MINEIEHIVTNYIENYNQKKHGGYEYDIAVLKSSKEIYKEGDTTRSIICLGALSADNYAQTHNDQKIKTVGWGKTYNEYPKRDPFFKETYGYEQKHDPIRTSCTTNQYGPMKSRFTSCDISFLKKNKWSCKKIKNIQKRKPKIKELPNYSSKPSYQFDECEKYFPAAENLLGNELSKASIKWTEDLADVKNLDVYQVIELGNNRQDVEVLNCYRKELFETNGWCQVDIGDNKRDHDDWGFCDSSCEGASVRIKCLLFLALIYKSYTIFRTFKNNLYRYFVSDVLEKLWQ